MSAIFDTKFITLLRTFDETELRDFRQWLLSPWCNSNKNLPRLFEELRRYYPHFTNSQLTKELLFERVLPDGKYSDRRLNNLMSEAFQAAERFLVFRRFGQDRHQQQRTLATELERRHLDDWFFKRVRKEMQALEEEPVKSWDDNLLLFRLQQSIYHHPTKSPRNKAGDQTIVQLGDRLDLLYLLEKAVIIEEKRTRFRVLQNEPHDVNMDIERWLIAAEGMEHPAIQLYRLRFELPSTPGIDHYWEIREAFAEQLPLLNEREQKLHLIYLINDTMQLIKQGVFDITEILPLYKVGLGANLLLHNGQMTVNTYTSIVVASNTKGEFDFTHHFIANYTKYVDEAVQADCERWGKAHSAYWSKRLHFCMSLIRNQEFDTPYFQFVARVVRTQAYFDLYLQEASYRTYLFSYFDKYERWLYRNKLYAKSVKKTFLLFVKKARQLARYYEAGTFEPDKVAKLLEDTPNIQALNWLKQKQREVLTLRQTD
jgi:hypothetical protein